MQKEKLISQFFRDHRPSPPGWALQEQKHQPFRFSQSLRLHLSPFCCSSHLMLSSSVSSASSCLALHRLIPEDSQGRESSSTFIFSSSAAESHTLNTGIKNNGTTYECCLVGPGREVALLYSFIQF